MDWLDFEQHCETLGFSATEALDEKMLELRGRHLLKMRPLGPMPTEHLNSYLTLALGRNPSALEMDFAETHEIRVRWDTDLQLKVFARQGQRCALCGEILQAHTRPHLDHITPIAFGGTNAVENIQVLCRKCNLGKGATITWPLGVVWATHRVLTARLRYVTLARASGRCEAKEGLERCMSTILNNHLVAVRRIPAHRGGQFLFDNLYALCEEHMRIYLNDLRAVQRSATKHWMASMKDRGSQNAA